MVHAVKLIMLERNTKIGDPKYSSVADDIAMDNHCLPICIGCQKFIKHLLKPDLLLLLLSR